MCFGVNFTMEQLYEDMKQTLSRLYEYLLMMGLNHSKIFEAMSTATQQMVTYDTTCQVNGAWF